MTRAAQAGPETDDDPGAIDSLSAELRRIDFTGTIWFGAAIIATSVALGGALSSGWRPTDLTPALGLVWWVGAIAVLAGIMALGWAGCPVFGTDPASADRQKAFCIRAGAPTYVGGMALVALAMLLG